MSACCVQSRGCVISKYPGIHQHIHPSGIRLLIKPAPDAVGCPGLFVHTAEDFTLPVFPDTVNPAQHSQHGRSGLAFIFFSQQGIPGNLSAIGFIDKGSGFCQKISCQGWSQPAPLLLTGQLPCQGNQPFILAVNNGIYQHGGKFQPELRARRVHTGCPAVYFLHGPGAFARKSRKQLAHKSVKLFFAHGFLLVQGFFYYPGQPV